MARTAIVTSSASDLPEELARSRGIVVVPSIVTFGRDEFRAGVDLSIDEFWARMVAADAPVPITSPPSPGAFKEAYEAAFAAGADAIVSVQMSARLSATVASARVAAEMDPDREIYLVDTRSTSMATGLLALLGAEMASLGVAAAEIANVLERRSADVELIAALDTFAYLRRGGRAPVAVPPDGPDPTARPIISIVNGEVEVIDRAGTLREARERAIEALTRRPVERLAILHSPPADGDAFRDEVVRRIPGGVDPARVIVYPIGLTIGPHVGPGCVGGVVLTAFGG